jgi:dihydrofolate reductase
MSQLIFAIYAVSENGIIGKEQDLPWHLPADSKHFRKQTLGKVVIMGRKSFEALGKPLDKRRNIVISSNPDFSHEGIEVADSLEAALALCKDEPEVAITGGASVYQESISKGYVTRIYETLVHADVEGDTMFVLPHPEHWSITEVDARQADDKHEYAYTFRTLEKIS